MCRKDLFHLKINEFYTSVNFYRYEEKKAKYVLLLQHDLVGFWREDGTVPGAIKDSGGYNPSV